MILEHILYNQYQQTLDIKHPLDLLNYPLKFIVNKALKPDKIKNCYNDVSIKSNTHVFFQQ